MTWFRLPLFVWAHYATSLIMILGTPVVAITVLLVAAERVLHLGIFDPALGGDPVLFQHLFWFYSHPAVYIMILPAMGVISEIVQAFSRKNIFGYSFIAFSSLAIAIIGFLVWGHHLFVAGQSVYAGLIFSFLSFLVAIPSAIKVFNWTATIYKGSVIARVADALRVRLHRAVHDRRADRASSSRRWASTSTCTTPTSSSRTSTTSWSAARSWATSAACTTGGRRSPAGCTRKGWAKFAALHGVRRVQPDVLPAVRRRLPRHAAPLSRVSAGVPGAATCCRRPARRSWRSATCCR